MDCTTDFLQPAYIDAMCESSPNKPNALTSFVSPTIIKLLCCRVCCFSEGSVSGYLIVCTFSYISIKTKTAAYVHGKMCL